MLQPLLLLAVSLLLAYCSQKEILVFPINEKRKLDVPLIVLVIALTLFAGLRTAYNDTNTYINMYELSVTVKEYWEQSPELLDNPLFYTMQSFFRHNVSESANVFFSCIALFSFASILRFIKKYSENFVFSILLFFALGLCISHIAAMKQCLAIAILTYALDALIKKKNLLFIALVFLAMLFHTYAIMFIVLPIFTEKPWTFVTYVSIAAILIVLLTFESTITGFLEYADDLGKEIAEDQVMDTAGINLFRLAVFGVLPVISFIFQAYTADEGTRTENLFTNMSLLSFFVMSLGIFSAANLFGRSAIYFEIGTIIIFPWIINKIFDKKTSTFILSLASICFIAFYTFANLDFSLNYSSMGIGEFLRILF